MAEKKITSVSDAKEHLNKIMGKDTIISLEGEALPHPAWSTGSFLIDVITGIGGIPKGMLLEFFGQESSGKSTVCTSIAKAVQDAGMPVMYADYECSMDRKYLRAQGLNLDPDWFIYAQPDSMEKGLQMAQFLAERKLVGLCIFDSLAAMATGAQNAANIGEEGMKDNLSGATVLASAMKKLVPICHKSGTTIIFINQLRQGIPTPFEARMGIKPEHTPGAAVLKFYAGMRMKFTKIAGTKGKILNPISGEWEDGIVATKIKAEVVKNKVAPPFRACEFIIRYGIGVDHVMSLVNVAVVRGIIKKESSFLTLPGKLFGNDIEPVRVQGLENLCNKFRGEWSKELTRLEGGIQQLINRDMALAMSDAYKEPEVGTEEEAMNEEELLGGKLIDGKDGKKVAL